MVTRRITGDDAVIAERIRLVGELAGATQMSIAEWLGVTFQQFQKYENGNNRMSASKLFLFAKIFEVDIRCFDPGRSVAVKDNKLVIVVPEVPVNPAYQAAAKALTKVPQAGLPEATRLLRALAAQYG